MYILRPNQDKLTTSVQGAMPKYYLSVIVYFQWSQPRAQQCRKIMPIVHGYLYIVQVVYSTRLPEQCV